MAVAAIHPEASDMMRVAEGYGLFPGLVGACGVRRPVQHGKDPRQKSQDEDRAEYGDPGERICAAMKNLSHGLAPTQTECQNILISHRRKKQQPPTRLPSYQIAPSSLPCLSLKYIGCKTWNFVS
jgi:hypothetical protein